MTTARLFLIASLVAAITALHYLTAVSQLPLHGLYRELYLLPIILAGVWGGKKAGLGASVAASLLYLPHVLLLARQVSTGHMMQPVEAVSESTYGNLLEVVVFNLAGWLAGAYGDLRRGYLASTRAPYRKVNFGRRFLLCVDGTAAGQYAAQYLAEVFAGIPGLQVTLAAAGRAADADNLPAEGEAGLASRGHLAALDQARAILLQGGIAEADLELRPLVAGPKERVTDLLLKELERGEYHTVVVGKHELSKTQEFLFGSVAVNLVRAAGVSVLVVKGAGGGGEAAQEPPG